jgi:hypothetical protein
MKKLLPLNLLLKHKLSQKFSHKLSHKLSQKLSHSSFGGERGRRLILF